MYGMYRVDRMKKKWRMAGLAQQIVSAETESEEGSQRGDLASSVLATKTSAEDIRTGWSAHTHTLTHNRAWVWRGQWLGMLSHTIRSSFESREA